MFTKMQKLPIKYFDTHKDEFVTADDKDGLVKYTNYKLKELKNVTEKTTYIITFNLTKLNLFLHQIMAIKNISD